MAHRNNCCLRADLRLSARLSSTDADAVAQLARITADGGYSADDALLSSLIRDFKLGTGGAGDCYAMLDWLLMPGAFCKKDGANKVSKIYDLSASKGASYGTSGYYDAVQSTASLQQVVTGTALEGNLLRQSAALNTSPWATASASIVTSVADPDGGTGAYRVTFASGGQLYQQIPHIAGRGWNRSVSVWARKADTSGAANIRITTNNTSAWSSGVTQSFALTSSWQRIELPAQDLIQSGKNTNGCAIIFGAVLLDGSGDATCAGAVELYHPQVREQAWASTYVDTTTIIKTPGPDGIPALKFDGSAGLNYTVSGSILDVPTPTAVFVVARKDRWASIHETIMDSSTAGGVQRQAIYFDDTTTNIEAAAPATMEFATRQFEWGVYYLFSQSGSASIYRNASLLTTSAQTTNSRGGALKVGAAYNNTSPFAGTLALVAATKTGTTLAQVQYIASVLSQYFRSAT